MCDKELRKKSENICTSNDKVRRTFCKPFGKMSNELRKNELHLYLR